jgi:hypothetical protein
MRAGAKGAYRDRHTHEGERMMSEWSFFSAPVAVETMLLLTDGRVFCHELETPRWWFLTPDRSGSYANGTWERAADLPPLTSGPDAPGPNAPLAFASAILRSGNVFVAGGEYNGGGQEPVDLSAVQMYNPVAHMWSVLPPAPWEKIGDACCCVLADGRVLLGAIVGNATAIFDPEQQDWYPAGPNQNETSNEETWTLLPDGSVLTVDCYNHPGAERYVPSSNLWVSAGMTPVDLVEDSSKEIGPALLLADGRVFAIGATGNTALYTPNATGMGTWLAGPCFPRVNDQTIGAKDAPAALLPNGRVLCTGGRVTGEEKYYGEKSTYFFEFDPVLNTLNRIADAPNNDDAPYTGRMLLLPTGQVFFVNGKTTIAVYSPDGEPAAAWRPRITKMETALTPGKTYRLTGEQLNGLSQAVSYGDDATMATNYPIVRLQYATGVHYCRTGNHSTMGVATAAVPQSTDVTIPAGAPPGAADLLLIANGIASQPYRVSIAQPRRESVPR